MTVKTGYRRDAETFKGIIWKPQIRESHYKKCGIDFPIAKKLDWERVLKRKGFERPGEPVRFNALVGMPGADLVFLAVYTRLDDWLNIISIRRADVEERTLFLGR
jgi:uncharacterized DUF497 family protein